MTSLASKKRHEILVYVAGPYTAPILNQLHDNVHRARQVAAELWELGFTVFCPHMNSFMMDGIIPHDEWYKRDLVILERCDVLILLPGWKKSRGSVGERKFAEEHGMIIVEWANAEQRLNFLRRY